MNIFEAKSAKSYLLARMKLLPNNGHGEASRMAKALGISSTLMSQILAGQRSLSLEQGELLTEYFALRPLECDYFMFLIQYERSGTARLREYWKAKLEKVKTDSKNLVNRVEPKKILSEPEKAVFYSSPIFASVCLYTTTSAKGRTADEIAQRFQLSRAKVAKLTNFLIETGLLEEKNNRLKMGAQRTHLESTSPHLVKHHSNWRLKAMQCAEDVSESELMFTSPVSLSKEDFDRLREKMVLMIKDFLAVTEASPADEIACFNLDFFWLRK